LWWGCSSRSSSSSGSGGGGSSSSSSSSSGSGGGGSSSSSTAPSLNFRIKFYQYGRANRAAIPKVILPTNKELVYKINKQAVDHLLVLV